MAPVPKTRSPSSLIKAAAVSQKTAEIDAALKAKLPAVGHAINRKRVRIAAIRRDPRNGQPVYNSSS